MEESKFRQVEIHRVQLAVQKAITDFEFSISLDPQVLYDRVARECVVDIRAWIAAGKHTETGDGYCINVPQRWVRDGLWAWLKEAAPFGWIRRFAEARYQNRSIQTIFVNNYRVCPHVAVPYTDAVHYAYMADDEWAQYPGMADKTVPLSELGDGGPLVNLKQYEPVGLATAHGLSLLCLDR